jgi:hypothetical protein
MKGFTVILSIFVLLPITGFTEQAYQCEWFHLRYPDEWIKIADFDTAGVVYFYPDEKIGPQDAMITVRSLGPIDYYYELKHKLLYSLYRRNDPRMEIGKMEVDRIDNARIPVMVLRYPVELSLGRVAAWKYKRLYFFLCQEKNLGIVIEVEYVLKERVKVLKSILRSMKWKKKIIDLDEIEKDK